jgi:hypothetical protein
VGEEDGAVDLVSHLALSGLGTKNQVKSVSKLPYDEDPKPRITLKLNLHIISKGVVVALFVLDTLLAQPLDRISVAHAQEWASRLDEIGVVLLNRLGGNGVLKCQVNYPADDVLEMAQEIVKGNKVELGFDVGVFGKLQVGHLAGCSSQD